MYVLREYQDKAVNISVSNFTNYKCPFIVVAPTGSGKSLIIANIAKQLENVLILQPSKEILESNYAKMVAYHCSDDVKIYSASMKSKEIGRFTYATIGSIYRKPELFKHFKYVIVDECHLVNPKGLKGMYNTFFNAIGNPKIMGLTATPYRLVQRFYREGETLIYTTHLQMLNRIYPFFFKKIVYEKPIKELVSEGYLAKLEYIEGDSDFDLTDIPLNSTGADFDSALLDKYLTTDNRLKKIFNSVFEIKDHVKHILIFASSVRQSNKIKEMLTPLITIEMVSADTPQKERDRIVDDFRQGNIKAIVNMGIFTVGFDFPELDCIILARPTMSLALFYQCVGRGIRISPSKEKSYIIDCSGNVKKFGRIETIEIDKEDGFKNIVKTEKGVVSGKPLFTFKVKKEIFKTKKDSTKQSVIDISF